MTHRKKPCVFCGQLAPCAWNFERVFDSWVDANKVVAPWRSRFGGMRAILEWASVDETQTGAHQACALQAAIQLCGYANRYPKLGLGKTARIPSTFQIPEELI